MDAERLARETAREQAGAARKLSEAARGIRDNRIRDKLAFSKDLLRRGSPEYIENFENQISENLEQAAQQLAEAGRAVGQSPENRQAKALERARDLVRGLESLNERARAAERQANGEEQQSGAQNQRTQQGQAGREGQQGQQGQAGQQAREGQQGQQGQQGKPGQQGQQGQKGQQGQEGQQGQAGQQGQQGQTGQQGQQGQQGQGRNQEGQPSEGQPTGDPNSPMNGRFDNDGTRQFVREFRARRQVAESLRADLRALGVPTNDLDQLLSRFRQLDKAQTFGDVRGLDRLESDLIDGLKELEFTLWRQFGQEGEQRPTLGASARVPPQYRELVEEYYRSLSRQRDNKP